MTEIKAKLGITSPSQELGLQAFEQAKEAAIYYLRAAELDNELDATALPSFINDMSHRLGLGPRFYLELASIDWDELLAAKVTSFRDAA